MDDYVRCGTLNVDGQLCPIYCDETVGDIFVKKPDGTYCLFSNMTLLDPVPLSDESLKSIYEALDCLGFILTRTYTVVLDTAKAYYKVANNIVKHTVDYNLNTEYKMN